MRHPLIRLARDGRRARSRFVLAYGADACRRFAGPVTAAVGGVWGAALARAGFELWPGPATASPLFAAAAIGCAAAGALAALGRATSRAGGSALLLFWPLALGIAYLAQPTVAPLWGVAACAAGAAGVIWLAWPAAAGLAARKAWIWDAAVGGAALALYLSTLAPSVLPGDSGEFQFAAPTLSIPHPTGYPLYLVLGKLFSTLPLSPAQALNLLSAVAAAGAVWAVYRAGRALDLYPAAAATGAALLAVSETFWAQATVAEKYTLNAFFAALSLWLALRWLAARRRGERGRGWLAAWALCYGLSLTHHRTMLLFAPIFLGLFLLAGRPRRDAYLLLLALPPLALYLLLPLFSAWDPPYAYIRVDSARAFADLVLARSYQSGLFRSGWGALSGRLAAGARLFVRQAGVPGLVLAVGGWAALLRRRPPAAAALGAGVLVQVAFALNYDVPNTPVYYLPAYVWLAVCAAAGVHGGLQALARLSPAAWSRHSLLAGALLAAALPLGLGGARWRGMDQGRAYAGLAFDYAYGQAALSAAADGALIVSDWQPGTVLWYMQQVEGLAPSVQVQVVDSLEWQWQEPVAAALAAGRPVYLSRPVMAAADRYPLRSAGPLVQVLAAPDASSPQPAVRVDAALGSVRLAGYDLAVTPPGPESALQAVTGDEIAGGSTLYLTLYWQAAASPAGDDAVTLRLLDGRGQERLVRQSRHPVGGSYPTSRWTAGEAVADAYTLDLPPWLPSDRYTLWVTMGPPSGGDGGSVRLEAIQVRKPAAWPNAAADVPLRRRCGEGLLLAGYDGPREIARGEPASLGLHWLVWEDRSAAPRPELSMLLADGRRVPLSPLPGSAGDWQPGARIVEPYAIDAPADLRRLQVQCDRATYSLPVRVVDAPPPVATFDGVRLRGYTYASAKVAAGETVRLTLEWEPLRSLGEPYKVFVHVLGPDGLPVAQQDNEPLNNTYPTTRWQPGERISDPYAFALPPGLAPGTYPVEVGLYRISDLSRLPVLDAARQVVDDKVFLAPITVR